MAFSDGDPFVSGSLYSFQQGNRMMQNYRGASVPSNLQDGALWSDSDDDRLWHQGASLDEVFTEQTTLTWENLLANSGFGVWSQSDASKGLATITYDAGSKGAGAAPSVGDAVVGGTSGATAKVISYTILTGAFADNDATGVVTVGAVSHDFAFVDNETITFGGVETAVVNMPDSAVQVGLVQNGGFAAATTGWSTSNCTIASVAGGKVGNCLEITRTAGDSQYARVGVTLEIGKIYKTGFYVKSGTSGDEAFKISVYDGSGWHNLEGTSSAAWVLYTITIEALGTTGYNDIYKNTATAGTMLFDEVTDYEITPCCTAADNLAFDGWYKDTTLYLYRQHNDGGTLTKDGSFYSLKCVPSAANDFLIFPYTYTVEEWAQQFAGRTITVGAWFKTSSASHVSIRIYDSAGNTNSSAHTGGGAWEWLEVTHAVDAAATTLRIEVRLVNAGATDGSTVVYISQPMLVFGSHIGEGNYQPILQEWIYATGQILSNYFQVSAEWSDDSGTINLEADSDAKLPKGAKATLMRSVIYDSGSLATATGGRFLCRGGATAGYGHSNYVSGKANNAYGSQVGPNPCDRDGNYRYSIDATGVGTFGIAAFYYVGVQVN